MLPMRDVRTSEDRATQLLICEKLSLAIFNLQIEDFFLVMTIGRHQGSQRLHVCLGIPGNNVLLITCNNVLGSWFARKRSSTWQQQPRACESAGACPGSEGNSPLGRERAPCICSQSRLLLFIDGLMVG